MSPSHPTPLVVPDEGGSPFTSVRGVFYRAVHPDHVDAALSGSRADGRYAPAHRPTLYLSSSPEGVAAAMTKYVDRDAERLVTPLEVIARRIADLRDARAMAALGVDPHEAASDWQQALADGRVPASWGVRDALQDAGALGLIDPSRKRPGLWHLTLFAWNRPGAPVVRSPGAPDQAGRCTA
jgi:RES domain-containing protein